jgi:predicted TIM-barrel fold metal-dependent hydrolase
MESVNVHEHIESRREISKLLTVMDALEIRKTILVGSSRFTITLNPAHGFTGYDANNDELIEIRRAHPDRFEAWPTIDPLDPGKLEKLAALHERGATGLKLYLGHGFVSPLNGQYLFHVMPMDDERMAGVYDYCQETFLPICFHVNPGPTKPGFLGEFIAVARAFPDAVIVVPHWALSSIRLARLEALLSAFPNLWTDISFGHDDYLLAGLRRISRNPRKYREFIASFGGRVLFGTDLVITSAKRKDAAWITERMQAYLMMISEKVYESPLLPGERHRGLGLAGHPLNGILHANYQRLRQSRPRGTRLEQVPDWSEFEIAHR